MGIFLFIYTFNKYLYKILACKNSSHRIASHAEQQSTNSHSHNHIFALANTSSKCTAKSEWKSAAQGWRERREAKDSLRFLCWFCIFDLILLKWLKWEMRAAAAATTTTAATVAKATHLWEWPTGTKWAQNDRKLRAWGVRVISGSDIHTHL